MVKPFKVTVTRKKIISSDYIVSKEEFMVKEKGEKGLAIKLVSCLILGLLFSLHIGLELIGYRLLFRVDFLHFTSNKSPDWDK